ncbi:MAG: DNA topoisomerase IV subunit A [Alphaproteobacteria bacterium]|nr:DNA topoisomerase IV subunit A [Alphaproteobacteria bacterium]
MAKVATLPPAGGGSIREQALMEALGERYLAYALSTITSRSLPDVRDGLKPVHRRLLYAMRQLRLDPQSAFKKCARVVGDVIGKYHPHGDQAVYDAMVRLAQSFSVRYPLVDGQGNFGNIDGDNAAAMRYTEARLTAIAEAMLEGIEEDAVDFRPTYDGSEVEPVVLPARFPNLLANGSSGIAVGMATSIPPHNAGELCDALLHLIKFPRATIGKLIEFVPGPDFPTGGVLAEAPESIREAYATGRGSFRLRARWAVEKLGRGTWQIVVTEIPFQVQKSRLIEKIAEQLNDKKLPLLADIRDESADDVRIVLEPRSRSVEPEHLMEMMFRSTDFEARIPLNMNVLEEGRTPKVMNLREVLQAFLDHRHTVLLRRSRFRLQRIEERLEILEGYLIAYLNLDKVIRIIRDSDEPKPKLVKAFKLTDNQAEAILNMRLRALRRLEEMEIRGEHEKLSAERREIKRLLKDHDRRWAVIAEEIRKTRREFGEGLAEGKRRTEIGAAPKEVEVPLESFVEKEPITVVCSAMGWIRALKGHQEPSEDVKYKEGDQGRFWLKAETTDKVLVFASNGRFYTLAGDKLPSGRGHGEPVRLMVDLPNEAQIVQLLVHRPGRKLVVAASDGRGFMVPEDQVVAQTRAGKQVLNVKDAVKAAGCAAVDGDSLALIGENRKLLVVPMAEVPELNRGRGVRLQRYRDGGLSDLKTFTRKDGLTWVNAGRTFSETALAPWAGSRGQAGRLPPKGFPKSNRFA